MFIYPFPCPKCGKFGVRDGLVRYYKMMPSLPPEPCFSYTGEECVYCSKCSWHSETASQEHERLHGVEEELQKRLDSLEKQLGIAQHNVWVAGNEAQRANSRLFRMGQRGY